MHELTRLAALFRPYWRWMLAGLALSCLTILANFGLMALSGWFLAGTALAGLAGYAAQNAFNFFTPAACVRFFATLRVGSRYAERLVTHEATFRLLAELRVWLYTRIEPLAPAGLHEYRAGDLLARLSADIDTLSQFYLRAYVPLLAALVCGLVMAAVFVPFSALAALILALGLAFTGIALPLFAARAGRGAGEEMTRHAAELRAVYVDAMQGMGELLACGAEQTLLARAGEANARLIAAQRRMSRVSGTGLAGAGLATNVTLLAVVLAGGMRLAAGRMGAADLPLLALGCMAAFEAVAPLPVAFQYLGQVRAAARRIFILADTQPAIHPPAAPAPHPSGPRLVLENLSLRYAPDAPWALRNLSLIAEPGQKIGIVGPSGAGKSTLINLLLRFSEFQEGTASFGGHDLRAYGSADMARFVTIISQRSHLFNTTIRDNLLLANGAADEAALWHALEVAQLAAYIRAQPQGLDTQVGEAGARLSGGQARRVALARAVLRPTPWLILDEPTEGLDSATEQAFLRDLAPVLEGRNVFYISHRPAGLALMDMVYRLEAGRLTRQS